jgi:hypothetical protein
MSLANDPVVGERMVWVDFVDRFTARIRCSLQGAFNNENTAQRMLDIKSNSWFAVIGRFDNAMLPAQGGSQAGKQYAMEWYRVLNAADRVQRDSSDPTMWYREATLAGREFDDPTVSSTGVAYDDIDTSFSYADMQGTPNPRSGWGVIITGVRGVYEKTIYVDRPSMYAPDN